MVLGPPCRASATTVACYSPKDALLENKRLRVCPQMPVTEM